MTRSPSPHARGSAAGRLLLAGLLTVLGGAPAGAAPGIEARKLERAGLAAEAALDFSGAFDAYVGALRASVAGVAAKDASEEARALDGAAGEAQLLKLAFLANRSGRWADVLPVVEEIRRLGLPPLLDHRAAFLEARARLARGDAKGAEKAVEGQGYLPSFAIAGPFDNERGSGFQTAYEPEKGEIDLAARYPGKGKEVGWRVPPRAAFLGEVDLDAHLRPNDEALAFALTHVRWDGEPRWVALRLGSDEGLKVWWNGAGVLSRDVNREVELDQDVVPVFVRKGWNRLLLKVTERKGDWSFRARLTELDGRPLVGLVTDPTPQGPIPPAATTAADAPKPMLASESALARLEAAGKADALDLLRLGYILFRRHAHDENEHPDRDAYKRAVALDEKDPIARTYLALVSAQAGEFSVNKEENAKRWELEKALELDPKQARAALLLAEYYQSSLGITEKAAFFVEKALAAAPGSLDAKLQRVDLLARRGMTALARLELERMLSQDPQVARSAAALRRQADILRSRGALQEGVAKLRQALALDQLDGATREALAEALTASGDPLAAVPLFEERAALSPMNQSVLLRIAQRYAAAERFEEALTALDRALLIAPEDDGAIATRGRTLLRLGRKAEALAEFERALALNPKLVDLRRYLELLREDEKPWEDEYRLDVEEALASAAKIALDKEVATRILLDHTVARVNPDGTSSTFEQRVLRVENDDGVEQNDSHGVPYSVGEEKVTILRATVVKKDGRREEAKIDNFASDFGRGGEFSTYSYRAVDLPTVAVGDMIIVEHRKDELRQSFFGDYFGFTHAFQGTEPIERSRFTLVAPPSRELHFHPKRLDVTPAKGTAADGKSLVYTWEKRGMPRIEQEPNMPPLEEVAPSIQVSTFKDWNAFAKWYWNLVRKQQEVSEEMRAKVEELTKGKSTREEKIAAIYDFVVTDVRYNDHWEFGVHGFKPYNASAIFARRFGDCKDKATLIITMLSVIGVPGFPVLIDGQSERGLEDLSLPLMDHFNHCIAFVPGPAPDGKEGWFLDGTAQHHSSQQLPTMDYGATVLIVKPDGGEIRKVKWPDPLAENGLSEAHRVAVRADGGALLEAELQPRGGAASVVRQVFENPGQRKETLEKIYGRHFAGATVLEESFSDLKDLNRPVQVRFKLDVPKYLKPAVGGYSLEEVPCVLFEWLYADDMSDMAPKAERRYDVVLPCPAGYEEAIEYALPEGFTVRTAPKEVRLDGEFGTYVKTYEVKGGVLRVTRRLIVKTQRVPVSRYEEWRKFVNEVDRADDERAILGKGGLAE